MQTKISPKLHEWSLKPCFKIEEAFKPMTFIVDPSGTLSTIRNMQ